MTTEIKRNIFINKVWENSNENVIPKKVYLSSQKKTTTKWENERYAANNIDLTNSQSITHARKEQYAKRSNSRTVEKQKNHGQQTSAIYIYNLSKQAN